MLSKAAPETRLQISAGAPRAAGVLFALLSADALRTRARKPDHRGGEPHGHPCAHRLGCCRGGNGRCLGPSSASLGRGRAGRRLGQGGPGGRGATIPGAIVGIWQDGREPYVRAFGVRDAATRQPMATDLYMRIGSNSKAFTVTAILML